MLRASFPSFALPADGPRLSLLLRVTSASCGPFRRGALLGLGGGATPPLDVSLTCSTRQLVLAGGLGQVTYQLPTDTTDAGGGMVLLLSWDRQRGAFGVCADGRQLAPAAGASPALLQQLAGNDGTAGSSVAQLLGPAVILGARYDTSPSLRADIAGVWATDAAVPCDATAPGAALDALLQQLAADAATTSAAPLPTVAVEQQPAAAVVGQPVALTVVATPAGAGDALRCVGGAGCRAGQRDT